VNEINQPLINRSQNSTGAPPLSASDCQRNVPLLAYTAKASAIDFKPINIDDRAIPAPLMIGKY